MRIVAIIQARVGSTRLPRKVLLDLAGEPMLTHVANRSKEISLVDEVVIATTKSQGDDEIEDMCRRYELSCFRGSEEDVLDRYYQAATKFDATHIVRITSDCPLICPREAERLISHHLSFDADYSHNITVWGSGMPLGTGVEIFNFDTLESSWKEGKEPYHREHVDEYVYEHPERFHIESIRAPSQLLRPKLRLTVDQREDYNLLYEIYGRLYIPGNIIELKDVINLMDQEPDLLDINKHVVQKRI